nr:hypothetical protein [Tanacetum cinerariifolium]
MPSYHTTTFTSISVPPSSPSPATSSHPPPTNSRPTTPLSKHHYHVAGVHFTTSDTIVLPTSPRPPSPSPSPPPYTVIVITNAPPLSRTNIIPSLPPSPPRPPTAHRHSRQPPDMLPPTPCTATLTTTITSKPPPLHLFLILDGYFLV